jgi:aminopeptidase N
MYRALIEGARGGPADPSAVVAAMRGTLRSNELDPAFIGEALLLPSEGLVGDRMDVVDPDAIHRSREALRRSIGSELAAELAQVQSATAPGSDLSASAKGVRKLKTVALWLLAGGDPERGSAMAKAQFDHADNMTDRQGALSVLTSLEGPDREAAFAAFHERYREDSLVLDKWFALQAVAQRSDTIDVVEALARHEDFGIRNPNRWRALVSNFAANQWAFHHPSGRGYSFVADMILEVDRMNPQVGARQVPSLGRWRRFETKRGDMMRKELERIVATPGISRDVYEQASKSLA